MNIPPPIPGTMPPTNIGGPPSPLPAHRYSQSNSGSNMSPRPITIATMRSPMGAQYEHVRTRSSQTSPPDSGMVSPSGLGLVSPPVPSYSQDDDDEMYGPSRSPLHASGSIPPPVHGSITDDGRTQSGTFLPMSPRTQLARARPPVGGVGIPGIPPPAQQPPQQQAAFQQQLQQQLQQQFQQQQHGGWR